VVWQPYFAPLFPLWLLRLAVLLHSLAASLRWWRDRACVRRLLVRGSIPAMTRGT